jgi:uncharacterized protein YbjT (DUF2867 family)
MKILLTGATGYIGKRIIPALLDEGHQIICCVRDKKRFPSEGIYSNPNISLYEVDFLNETPYPELTKDIDAAYYLIHSMSTNRKDFEKLEIRTANNFIKLLSGTAVKQIIYLGGITNEKKLSRHLESRRKVEEVLKSGNIPVTSIKAGIIVGSGSASFEIIRDLVEKLPVMIAPRWLNTKHQPVAIRDVIKYLTGVLMMRETYNKSYDIGGPDILSYKEMLLRFAEERGLKRYVFTIPVMTPRLSSYWLYFVTSTSYRLAINLVNSMKIEVVAANNDLEKLLNIESTSYKKALQYAFQNIEQNNVVSSWKDALISSYSDNSLLQHINVPVNGCYSDVRKKDIGKNRDLVLDKIWSIGGKQGWYYGNWLWEIRGILDKMFGGVGLRRGRTNEHTINTGDTVDFWRVLAADRVNARLLLYAEMKLPGEAWLEFRIIKEEDNYSLIQTATFRPKGLLGRLYWFSVLPFHYFIFNGMADNIIRLQKGK